MIKEPLSILYYHYTLSKDGQHVHIEAIIESFKELGCIVNVIGPYIGRKATRGEGSACIGLLRQKLPSIFSETMELLFNLTGMIRIIVAIFYQKPDFIYARYSIYAPSALIVARILHIPIFLEVNAPLAEERSRFGGIRMTSIAYNLEKWQWKSADYICTVTNVLANIVKNVSKNQNVYVVPNGIYMDRYKDLLRSPEAKAIFHLPQTCTIGFVGHIREWHAVDELLLSIKALQSKEVFLLIIGDGPAKSILEKITDDIGVSEKVRFEGFVSGEELPAYLAAIDIAIQPRALYYASPLKLVEYMAAGCAIVAPNQENIKELLENKINAILFERGAMTESISQLVDDVELRKTISCNARAKISNCCLSWRNNAMRIIEIYTSNVEKPIDNRRFDECSGCDRG